MSVSQSKALTEQFYAWEKRGRGWLVADFPVDLEPVFEPFFGHYVAGDIIDDGKRPHWLATLFSNTHTIEDTSKYTAISDTLYSAYQYEAQSPLIIYSAHLPKAFKPSLERVEQLLIMLSYRTSPISFEIIGSATDITVQWVCEAHDQALFSSQLHAFFPEVLIRETEDDSLEDLLDNADALYMIDFGLKEEFMRPLASGSAHDPYTPLFGILDHLADSEAFAIQILFTGTANAWAKSIMASVSDNTGRASFFADDPDMPVLAREKTSRPLFAVSIRAVSASDELANAHALLQHAATALVHASTSPHNALIPVANTNPDFEYTIDERVSDMVLRQSHRVGMLLNSRELTTFVHFPGPPIQSRKLISETGNTKALPDGCIGHPYCLGLNVHNRVETQASLSTEQRLRHIHIMGATGTGKSTLLHSLIAQDIHAGNGLMVIDPHGDLITTILASIPQSRVHDVVLIDPTDRDFPVGFNILSTYSDVEKEIVASDLVALFKRFSTSWGDQMNSVLANAIMALVYNTKQFHIGDVRKMLVDAQYRNIILATATDPDITYYWQHEFPILKGGSVGPILTRLDSFLRPKAIRSMVCQPTGLDMAQLMDSKKIVLVKLSQGLMGTENSYLLGAFIVSKLQQTALSRQAQAAINRIPFFCYIDEFQHFVTPSMASILSGARKYGLGLVLAHQDMQQVSKYDSDIASSVLSNAGSRIVFRVGDTDAKRMQEGFSSFTADDLQNLPTGQAIVRVNTSNADFNLAVIPYNNDAESDNTNAIVAYSRNSYSVPLPGEKPLPPVSQHVAQTPTQPVEPPPAPIETREAKPAPDKEAQREHRYLQTFIKKLAEEYGYKASIEVPTPDSTGQVDVLLERDGKTIAVEISVTTSPEWELHNIKKCLAAGYGEVALCCKSAGKLKQVQQLIVQHLSAQEQQRIHLVTPDNIQQILSVNEPKPETHTVIKGYRVKVQYDQEGMNRQEVVKSIVRGGRK